MMLSKILMDLKVINKKLPLDLKSRVFMKSLLSFLCFTYMVKLIQLPLKKSTYVIQIITDNDTKTFPDRGYRFV